MALVLVREEPGRQAERGRYSALRCAVKSRGRTDREAGASCAETQRVGLSSGSGCPPVAVCRAGALGVGGVPSVPCCAQRTHGCAGCETGGPLRAVCARMGGASVSGSRRADDL